MPPESTEAPEYEQLVNIVNNMSQAFAPTDDTAWHPNAKSLMAWIMTGAQARRRALSGLRRGLWSVATEVTYRVDGEPVPEPAHLEGRGMVVVAPPLVDHLLDPTLRIAIHGMLLVGPAEYTAVDAASDLLDVLQRRGMRGIDDERIYQLREWILVELEAIDSDTGAQSEVSNG